MNFNVIIFLITSGAAKLSSYLWKVAQMFKRFLVEKNSQQIMKENF